jgi:hypothetical protein
MVQSGSRTRLSAEPFEGLRVFGDIRQAKTSQRPCDRVRCPRPYKPHPSRRHRVSQRSGSARWFGRSLGKLALCAIILGAKVRQVNLLRESERAASTTSHRQRPRLFSVRRVPMKYFSASRLAKRRSRWTRQSGQSLRRGFGRVIECEIRVGVKFDFDVKQYSVLDSPNKAVLSQALMTLAPMRQFSFAGEQQLSGAGT